MRLKILTHGHRWQERLKLAFIGLVGGSPPDVVKMLMYRPEFFGTPFSDLLHDVMRGPSRWSPGERELFAAYTSQLNRCAWCLDMHTVDARKIGVPQRKIDLIAAFDEAPSLFTERERAALAFTEAVTLISHDGVADDVWASVTASFTDQEAVSLLMAVAAINVWNRMNVAVRTALSD